MKLHLWIQIDLCRLSGSSKRMIPGLPKPALTVTPEALNLLGDISVKLHICSY